jgi:hypothetical protein
MLITCCDLMKPIWTLYIYHHSSGIGNVCAVRIFIKTKHLRLALINHHHHHLHYSPLWALAFLGFPDNRIFRGWGCQPHTHPPIWWTKPPYLWRLETGWPTYTPRHWVPILVAFYDTHELCWDYSYRLVTAQRFGFN